MNGRAQRLLACLYIAVMLYAAVSMTVYSFRHPEQTDTQRILNFKEALLWR